MVKTFSYGLWAPGPNCLPPKSGKLGPICRGPICPEPHPYQGLLPQHAFLGVRQLNQAFWSAFSDNNSGTAGKGKPRSTLLLLLSPTLGDSPEPECQWNQPRPRRPRRTPLPLEPPNVGIYTEYLSAVVPC